jgi:hypothetical protein
MLTLTRFLDTHVDGRALGIARIVLGMAAFAKGLVTLDLVSGYERESHLMFPYGPFELSTPDGTFATGIGIFWLVLALFFAAGFGTRVSGVLLTSAILLTIWIDQQFYSNHLYLLGTAVALMSIAGAGSRLSIDARRGLVSPTVPRWSVLLIKFQLTSVYFFAAVTKLNDNFLSGAVMERAFDPAMRERVERFIALDTLAPLAIVTELFLAFAFWSKRLRYLALPAGLGFHLLNVLIMGRSGTVNLSIFALIMLSLMIVFFTDRFAESKTNTQP